jgi:hypothetical protein
MRIAHCGGGFALTADRRESQPCGEEGCGGEGEGYADDGWRLDLVAEPPDAFDRHCHVDHEGDRRRQSQRSDLKTDPCSGDPCELQPSERKDSLKAGRRTASALR